MGQEDVAEDFCFVCKDGGDIRVCDFKNCLKAYHPLCVDKQEDFLESDETFICDWHMCSGCKKSSCFQCYCCPYSVCRECMKEEEFAVMKGMNGLCHLCLKCARMIEEKADVDSEGVKVDFKDTETAEYLFKDYWEIVKDKEGLNRDNVRAASARMKSRNDLKTIPEPVNHKEVSDEEFIPDNSDSELDTFARKKRKVGRPTKEQNKRCRLYEKSHVGWCTQVLIDFLKSIGTDISKPLTQGEVSDIVERYINENKLIQTHKKRQKLVICDDKLLSLFRKKQLPLKRIYTSLDSHFDVYLDEDEDDNDEDVDEDDDHITKKKARTSFVPNPRIQNKSSEPKKLWRVSFLESNIKLLYLRKSLIVDFLKDPDNFENKVVNCFVRVKNDPKDYFYSPQKPFQLGQVTGFKKAAESYKIGESHTDVLLCISNIRKEIKITMLSNDDFEKDEYEDLQEFVKKGLFKMPTYGEFENKLGIVRKDIVKHGIDQELLRLDKLIDQANEKGWRNEMFQHMGRKELLRKTDEQQRLLNEIPEIIAEPVEEVVLDAPAAVTKSEASKGGKNPDHAEAIPKEESGIHLIGDSTLISISTDSELQDDLDNPEADGDEAASNPEVQGGAGAADAPSPTDSASRNAVLNLGAENGNLDNNHGSVAADASSPTDSASRSVVLNLGAENGNLDSNHGSVAAVDAPAPTNSTSNGNVAINSAVGSGAENGILKNKNAAEYGDDRPVPADLHCWCYADPSGTVQGPYSLVMLRHWRRNGYFTKEFKVWKNWQQPDKGVNLDELLRQTSKT